jgi:hypothetical protein
MAHRLDLSEFDRPPSVEQIRELHRKLSLLSPATLRAPGGGRRAVAAGGLEVFWGSGSGAARRGGIIKGETHAENGTLEM